MDTLGYTIRNSKSTSKHVIELKDAIEVKAGLPDDMVGKEVAIAQVVEGGETQILKDQDNDPNTVTFNVTCSEAAYGLTVISEEEMAAMTRTLKTFLEVQKKQIITNFVWLRWNH